MPPKQKKPDVSVKENLLVQAVLVADSFSQKFHPLTSNRPEIMIAFLNTPILDYTLRMLRISGVQELFIFCSKHSDQIKSYVEENWTGKNSMDIQIHTSDSYQSLGDVIRDLDRKALVKSDFILISGGVVGNLPLTQLLNKHKARRTVDRGCVMTCVYMKNASSPGFRSDDVILATDTEGKILIYRRHGESKKSVKVPLQMMRENSRIKIQKNLLDTHVSLCSVNVSMLFTENVDHQTRDDFIRGTLVDEEILGHSVYIHTVDEGYAASISSFETYDSSSREVIRRWNHPILPEKIDEYSHRRHNIYLHRKNSTDTTGAVFDKNVIVGEGTMIQSSCHIKDSVIGSNCTIKNDVTIDASYIWDNVIIEDGCHVSRSILGNGVHLKSGTKIKDGCILSDGVVLGPDVEVSKSCIYWDPRCKKSVDPKLVGKEGKGFLYQMKRDGGWGRSKPLLEDFTSENEESESEADDLNLNEEDDVKIFFHEVLDNFKRGVVENISCENLILEVNSMKHAYNITINEVNVIVIQAIVELPHVIPKKDPNEPYEKCVFRIFDLLKGLVKNYIRSPESQIECLRSLEEYTLCKKDMLTPVILTKIIKKLYDEDILGEDQILEWYKKPKALPSLISLSEKSGQPSPGDQTSLRNENALKRLIQWLEETSEESTDNDD